MRRLASFFTSASGTTTRSSTEKVRINEYLIKKCCIPSSVLLEADGCCIDLIECASSSKRNNQASDKYHRHMNQGNSASPVVVSAPSGAPKLTDTPTK